MKQNWELDELIEHFTFLPNEMQQVGNKSGETRMGFAVLFKFFQYEARFPPPHKFEVPKAVIQYIAKQIETPAELYAQYDWAGRSITYHRTQIACSLPTAPYGLYPHLGKNNNSSWRTHPMN